METKTRKENLDKYKKQELIDFLITDVEQLEQHKEQLDVIKIKHREQDIKHKVKYSELAMKYDAQKVITQDARLGSKQLELDIKTMQQGSSLYDSLVGKKVTVFYSQYVMAGEKFEKYFRAKKIIDDTFGFLNEEHREEMIDKAVNYRSCTGIVEAIEQGAMKIRTGHGDKTYRYIISLKDIKNCKEYWGVEG